MEELLMISREGLKNKSEHGRWRQREYTATLFGQCAIVLDTAIYE